MKKTLTFLISIGVGGLIGYSIAKFLIPAGAGEAYKIPDGYGIWLLVLLPVMYLVVVGIHELGHVVAGKLNGFDFYGLTIGPFAWRPDETGKIRVRLNKNLNTAGGVAYMIPSGDKNLARRFASYAFGGPLVSLLLAGALYALSQVIAPPAFGYYLLATMAILSLFIFVVTILPFRSGGFSSDGLRVLTFLRNGPTAKAELAMLRAMTHLKSGQPYAALPVEEMAAVAEDESISEQLRVTVNYYRYLHALSDNDLATAGELLDGVMDRLEVYPAGTHGGFYLEQALFEARYRKDLPAAKAALSAYAPGPITDRLGEPLATAAVAALEEDISTLSAQLPLIYQQLPTTMDQSRVPIIKTWLLEWESLVGQSSAA